MTCCTRAVRKGLARYTLMKPGFTASRRSTTSEDGKAAMIFCVVDVRRSSTDMRGCSVALQHAGVTNVGAAYAVLDLQASSHLHDAVALVVVLELIGTAGRPNLRFHVHLAAAHRRSVSRARRQHTACEARAIRTPSVGRPPRWPR